MTVWHYTIADRLERILRSGKIRPGNRFVPRGERLAVWFSTNPAWEETANKSIVRNGILTHSTRADMIPLGLCRIGVDEATAPHTWEVHKRISGIPRTDAMNLEAVAVKDGAAPSEWRVSYKPIPADLWTSVQIWENDAWVDAPFVIKPRSSGWKSTSKKRRK